MYLNTDLELASSEDLTLLVEELQSQGWSVLHSERHDDRLWWAAFETPERKRRMPEATIAEMLSGLGKLSDPARTLLSGCTKRDFNIGYECRRGADRVEHQLSSPLLEQIAASGAAVVITIYPRG